MTAQNFTVDNGITVNGTGGNITGATNIEASGNITAHDITLGGSINGAGGLDIDGSANIGGNLFVTGNINFSGNVTQISGNSGVFYGNASTGSGALYAGKTGYTPVANTVVQVTGDLNDYIQVNLQNTNHGNTASMEIAITADDGNDTDNYIDIGIAGSTWDGTQTNSLGTAVAARDGYLYVQGGAAGGNLILGTTTAGYKVKFNAGGPGSANTVATVSNVGIETSGIVSATGNVRGGNINTAGVISATSNIIGGNINTAGVISATGNITGGNLITGGAFQSASLASAGNLTFTANNANIVFNNTAYISGNANSLGRDGSIVLQPYTGAGSIFPGVLIGGAGRILAPNGSAHLVLNASDVTLQVVTKAVAIASTSTTSGGIQAGGGIGVVGNVYVGGGIVRTGTISQPAWTTTGVGLQLPAATYTDTTSNGTVGNAYIHAMGSPTLTTSNNTTFTNYATLFVDKPIASSNVTITNNYAMIANGNISINGNITSGNINTGLGSIVSSNVSAGGYLSSAGNINLGAGSFIRSINTLNSNTWGANGAGIIWPAITYNDINATSGTQAVSYIHLLGAPTIGFQTPVTVTNAATLYVDRPVPGSNSTLTNPWAILANGSISVTANVSSGNVNTGFISVTGNVNPGNIYTTGNITGLTSGYTIGYRDIPQVVASGNAQFGLTDAGKHYYANNTGNITLTITNNSTLAFPIGTAISIVVQANSNVSVNAISGVSLYLSGNSTTGNRVVAPYGMATLMKVATDTWFINGSGVS